MPLISPVLVTVLIQWLPLKFAEQVHFIRYRYKPFFLVSKLVNDVFVVFYKVILKEYEWSLAQNFPDKIFSVFSEAALLRSYILKHFRGSLICNFIKIFLWLLLFFIFERLFKGWAASRGEWSMMLAFFSEDNAWKGYYLGSLEYLFQQCIFSEPSFFLARLLSSYWWTGHWHKRPRRC